MRQTPPADNTDPSSSAKKRRSEGEQQPIIHSGHEQVAFTEPSLLFTIPNAIDIRNDDANGPDPVTPEKQKLPTLTELLASSRRSRGRTRLPSHSKSPSDAQHGQGSKGKDKDAVRRAVRTLPAVSSYGEPSSPLLSSSPAATLPRMALVSGSTKTSDSDSACATAPPHAHRHHGHHRHHHRAAGTGTGTGGDHTPRRLSLTPSPLPLFSQQPDAFAPPFVSSQRATTRSGPDPGPGLGSGTHHGALRGGGGGGFLGVGYESRSQNQNDHQPQQQHSQNSAGTTTGGALGIGYNSQFDVESQIGHVADFLEKDVDYAGWLRDVPEEEEAVVLSSQSQSQSRSKE